MDFSSSALNTNPLLPPVGPPKRPRRETHRALFDFVAHNQHEVSIKKGDLLLVTEGDTHGWSLVQTEAGIGWVPSAYLEVFPAPPPSGPGEPPNPLVGQPCDACKTAGVECKLDSDVCGRCTEHGLLCTCMVDVGKALYVKGGWDKQGICIACRAKDIHPSSEPLCDSCKKNGIGCVERFPRFYYKPDWRPPGFMEREDLDPSTACMPCKSTETRCDQVEAVCSCCRERGVECLYGTSRDIVRFTVGREQDRLRLPTPALDMLKPCSYVFPCAEGWPCTSNAVCYYCREKTSLGSPAPETQHEQVLEALNSQVDEWEIVDRDEIEEEMKDAAI